MRARRLAAVAGLLACAFASSARAADPLPEASPAPAPSPAVAPSPAPTPPFELQYQHALDLYEHGDYAEAAKSLRDVIDGAPPGFPLEKIQRAWFYRGVSLFISGDKTGADKAFWQVLLKDPDFRPDPLFTLPAVIAAIDHLKEDNRDQLAKLPRISHRTSETPRDPLGVPLMNDPNQRNFVDAIAPVLPFGYAQYKNGQLGKAWALGISEGVLVAAIGGTYVSFQSLRKPGDRFHSDEIAAARLDKTINNAAYAALLAEIVYGAIDGVYYSATSRRAPVPAGRPQLAPGPGTAGLSVQIRF